MRIGLLWAAPLSLLAQLVVVWAVPPDWEKLENAKFLVGPENDGDSIQVAHGDRKYLFRLYFIDTPEEDEAAHSRRAGQAKYFGLIGPEAESQTLAVARQATELSRDQLSRPFVVWTRWDKVENAAQEPTFRAFVETSTGRDLATLLVEQGLAIIRTGPGSTADHPGGQQVDEILRDLRRTETIARLAGNGAWKHSTLAQAPPVAAAGTVSANDRQLLLGLAGQKAKVRGRVEGIGALADHRITFINFEGNPRGDFVAIIRAGSLAAVQAGFPQGLEAALVGQTIIVQGTVTLFKNIPEIEIETPEQITMVSDTIKSHP